jgi:integrase
MAKVEIILYQWKELKDGTNPIMLRISKYKDRKMLSTGLSCLPKQWNDEFGLFVNDKRLTKDYKEQNSVLSGIKVKAEKIITEFERLGIDFTIQQFANAFKKKTIDLNPSDYFDSHIEKLTETGKFGNADVFRSTLKILKIFDKKFDKLKFQDIDQDYIEKFDAFLRNDKSLNGRGLKDTSISVYMRTFATLLNAAIKDELMQPGAYPFSKGGYKISKLNVETKKRFIPIEYLKKLKSHKFQDLRLETARNLFLFSFHCRGINWIDMAYLTDENIKKEMSKDGKELKVLKFIRTKTHKEFEIIINSEIQSLLDWFRKHPHCKPYLLPIVTKPEHTGEALRQHIRDRRSKYNSALNEITKIEKLKFPESLQKITSYFSRHSYAMALRSKGIGIELISEALGHAELSTTNVYLDSFGREEVANASKNLI